MLDWDGTQIEAFSWTTLNPSVLVKTSEDPLGIFCDVQTTQTAGDSQVTFWANLSDGNVVSASAWLISTVRSTLATVVRFPENAAPMRTAINPDFFNADWIIRRDARQQAVWGPQIDSEVFSRWKGSALRFYVNPDLPVFLGKPENFIPNGAFDSSGRLEETLFVPPGVLRFNPLLTSFDTEAETKKVIYIWLVRELAPRPAMYPGGPLQPAAIGVSTHSGGLIFIADTAYTLFPSSYAHELGHSMGLDNYLPPHTEVRGLWNNFTPIDGPNAYLSMLMGPASQLDHLLTRTESTKARATALFHFASSGTPD